MSKPKFSPDIKIRACEEYLSGLYSAAQICEKCGITYNEKDGSSSSLSGWLARYKVMGADAFAISNHNRTYSAELKMRAIDDYLSGRDSILAITAKYNISDTKVFRKWLKMYNANMELKDYDPKREVYMAEARRKTTLEERKEVVEHCLKHNRDYKGAASAYDVSYHQVYSWVKKYDANGEDGLSDKRGRHKTDEEVDELEKLRRENLRLKRQLKERDMVVELLKKVKEFEGM